MQTKILVLHKKHLLLCIALLLIALLCLFLLTRQKKQPSVSPQSSGAASFTQETPLYRAGVYTSSLSLGETLLNLELILDANHIKSVRLVNLEESVTTMYPLIEPALDTLESQLTSDIPLNEIKLKDDIKYTQSLLLDVIRQTLSKASYAAEADTEVR